MPKRKIDWYGPKLRELRKQAGISQAELGQRVDLAGSQINKLETNVSQPTLATALAIAEALGTSIEQFCQESPASPPAAPRGAGKSKQSPDAIPPPRGAKTPKRPGRPKKGTP